MTPLSAEDVKTFDQWVAGVNHPEWRREEYREAYRRWCSGEVSKKKLKKKKDFVKAEWYDEPKFHRIIHSPHDEEKVLHGPYISAIEEKLFSRPEYIKKIPRKDWPLYVQSVVACAGLHVFGSDYESFEANFVPEIQQICELELVRYMCSSLSVDDGIEDILTTDGRVTHSSKFFEAYVEGRRCSGRMATSLFNGFSNSMFNLFVLTEMCGATEVRYVVEGDDGLFAHNGRPPTPNDYLRLGLTIKIEDVDKWHEASFCGMVFHPEAMDPLCDPLEVVCTAGWAGRDYIRAKDETLTLLAQVKGLSYLAQYPGCPVVQSVALWMLRTSGFEREKLTPLIQWYQELRSASWWDKQILQECSLGRVSARAVHPGSREVMHTKYGIEPTIQLELERRFDDDSTGFVDVSDLMPSKYRDNYYTSVRFGDRLDPELDFYWNPPEPSFAQNVFPAVRSDFYELDFRMTSMRKSPYV
jgi:hypothetical protein